MPVGYSRRIAEGGWGASDHRPVRITVLGRVRATVEGTPLPVGPRKQRLLLAVLVGRGGETVPVGELTEALWGGSPPPSAAENLRSYVHGLRRVLGSALLGGNGRIGYRLTTDDLTVDATEFLALAAEGERALAAGDPVTAGSRLREALGLWQGPPFADLGDVPALALEAARLEESRVLAVERRIEADLRAGAAADLVGELTTLVAQYPYRERFVEQLMLALYRSGRHVDALDVYRRTRAALRGDLGVEPGSGLADLQQAVLRRDPRLDRPDPVPAGLAGSLPARVGPAALPRDVPGFAGRTAELAWLDATLTPDADPEPTGVAVLSGTAGVGKTTLAVHWAHRVRERFPSGQLYVNLRGFDPTGPAVPPAEAVHVLLEALDVPPAEVPQDLQARTALYRTLLADRRMLIVLDNAGNAEQVRALLPGTRSCAVIVTSRHRLTGLVAIDDARPLVLDLLTDAEAMDLLRRRLGGDRVAREQAALRELVTRCARLPLALVIVAARAATEPDRPVATILATLRVGGDRLGAFTVDDDVRSDVRTVFSWSYRTLSDGAARLFRLVSLAFGAEFAGPAAASLAGVDEAETRLLLTELTRAHLLTEKAPGRYTVHDLLRAYAAELAADVDAAADRAAAVERLLDHYLHTAFAAAMRLHPNRDPIPLDPPRAGVTVPPVPTAEDAMVWFEAEYRVLLAIPGRPEVARTAVWRLAWTTWDFFNRRGYWTDWAALQQAAIAAAEATGDLAGRAASHRGLALAYGPLRRYPELAEHLGRSLELFRVLGDEVGEAHVHFTYSWLYEQLGEDEDAVVEAEHALRLFESAGHRFGQAQALNAVGWRYAQLGAYERALSYCERALDLLEKLGDRYGQAATSDSLGFANHRLGRYATAIACYGRALALFRDIDDRLNEAEALRHLGECHHAAGDDAAAGDAWRASLRLLEELKHDGAEEVRRRIAALPPHS
ncbi:AfsR/SARP family transcriptional regulator [Virgisporangium aurantiacum]|uniref:SARP family transcriptional regulator n=1 Tax=Virgisporangium aurantiacum TaxID=175570 RepID=A0A8J3Z4L2_9ACTN|nr:BTAD domain-containing putative transcriptional regulator [Virgisporangium aurantiacum]GIJ54860.1 SARP family transcriptional regulator [Virgisporangium aurantiacum]